MATVLLLLLLGFFSPAFTSSRFDTHPNVSNCTLRWFKQDVDHFGFKTPSIGKYFSQRYFTYEQYWGGPNFPIFFYTGNEGPVTLYANVTGLMWENAKHYKALIVFAEHRYYGESQLCGKNSFLHCPQYLTHEQALADYATLLEDLKASHNSNNSPVISFGGSYGGMLTAWFRMKYPETVVGGISASAPILAFRKDMRPAYSGSSYWKVVTDTARHHQPNCPTNVHKAVELVFKMGKTQQGRKELQSVLGLCKEPTPSTVSWVNYWIALGFDNMAMGDYPYPWRYIFGTNKVLPPAYPMKVACASLADSQLSGNKLLEQLREALKTPYNLTGETMCFDIPAPIAAAGEWDYQWCTELLPQEVPYFEAAGPPNDMFWKQTNWTLAHVTEHCQKTWGVTPRYGWIGTEYGGHDMEFTSNLVFSNGLLDPWHSGGVLHNSTSNHKFQAYLIADGAHHLDLFFSNPADPPSVKFVRKQELAHITEWLKEHYVAHPPNATTSTSQWEWNNFLNSL